MERDRWTYAFDDLDVDARAGGDVLAGGGEGDGDALGECGGGEGEDCEEGLHTWVGWGERRREMFGGLFGVEMTLEEGEDGLYTFQKCDMQLGAEH